MKRTTSKYVIGRTSGVSGRVHVVAMFKTNGRYGRSHDGYSTHADLTGTNYNTKYRKALLHAYYLHLNAEALGSRTRMQGYKTLSVKNEYESEEKIHIRKTQPLRHGRKAYAKKTGVPEYVLKRAKIKKPKGTPEYIVVEKKGKIIKRYKDKHKVPEKVSFKMKKKKDADKDIYLNKKQYKKSKS